MPFNTKGEFPEQDRLMLELQSKSEWVPPEPAALVAPYLEKKPIEEVQTVEARREKAHQVLRDYAKLIEECETTRAKIEAKCKNVVVSLDPENDARVIEAASRLFKREVTEITFEMYKEAIERLAKISNEGTPGTGGI